LTRPGVDKVDTVAWQTYQRRNGSVIYGGVPLAAAPARSGNGWTSGSFGGWRSALATSDH